MPPFTIDPDAFFEALAELERVKNTQRDTTPGITPEMRAAEEDD